MKKIFYFLIFFLFSFSFVKAENIENIFNDIDRNYKYYEELKFLYERGIILPDENGNFNPKSNLTRDEFVGIVAEISCKDCIKPNADFSFVEKYFGKEVFFDISEENKYFYCIADASATGQISGYQVGTSCQNGVSRAGEKPFCPENNILLEEALAIILRAGNILSISEAEEVRNEIRAGKIFENILNISPKLSTGEVYSFYPDFKKAYEYTFVDYDKNGVRKDLKLLDFSGEINPKQFVTKEDFLKISYIALKNNSCASKGKKDFGLQIKVLDKVCSERIKNCKDSDFPFGEKVFDFTGKISLKDDKNFVYNWRFYDFLTGKEVLRKGKYIDNYDFLKEGNYRVFLRVSSPDGENSEVYTDIKIGKKNIKQKDDFGLKIEVFEKNCSSLISNCKNAKLSGTEQVFDFNGKSTLENDKGYIYTWKFYDYFTGKENTLNGKYLDNYDFGRDGKYRVTLILESPKGKKTEVYNEINIFSNKKDSTQENKNPFSSRIIVDKTSEKIGKNINFTGVSNRNKVKYFWNFGDGKTGIGENINHKFGKAGTYKVTLTARDENGEESKSSIFVNIGNETSGLTSSIITDKIQVKKGEPIRFTGVSNKPFVKYSWDFGDGNTSSGENKNHSFGKDGVYTVKLIVSDDGGNNSSSTVKIKVGGKDTKKENFGFTSFIEADKLEVEEGGKVNFEGFTNKQIIGSYFWSFGDGNTASGKITSNNFINSGKYKVTLFVEDENGNFSSSTVNIKVIKNLENKDKDDDGNDDGDKDGDGVLDKDDSCVDIKGKKENFGCPIFEKSCKVDSDCKKGHFCDNGFCKIKKYSPNCAYTGGHIIKGNIECNSCPCEYELDYNASLRACDIIFPAITSPDGKDIYSKGKYFQIRK